MSLRNDFYPLFAHGGVTTVPRTLQVRLAPRPQVELCDLTV